MIVTIDGPAASGKTTVARMLAEKRGFYYLGSGVLYRALAYLLRTQCGYTDALMRAVQPADLKVLLDPQKFSYTYDAHAQESVFFQGYALDMTQLRTPAIANDASILAANGSVRKALLVLQRAIADDHDLIVEGRDAGSVVFPDADIKFFITASVAERARRYMKDQASRGVRLTAEQAVAMIEQRDERDKTRAIDPLVIPVGAVVVDTTNLSLEQVVSVLEGAIRK